jgi:hypothetical protein
VITQATLCLPVSTVTDLLIRVWGVYKFSIYAVNGTEEFSGVGGIRPYWAQLFSKMSNDTGDYQAFCNYNYGYCDPLPVVQIDESKYFKPKVRTSQ